MPSSVEGEKTWLERYLKPLVGFTVTEVEARVEDGHVWPVIHLVMKDRKGAENIILEISRDEEGNGPGFVFGLPKP